MKKNFLVIFLALSWFGIFSSHAQSAHITPGDIKQLLGDWKGTLTYLDYTTNKPYTMPSEVKISEIKRSHQLIFSNSYPNEPKANNADTVSISHRGEMIDKELVKTRIVLNNGNTEIITEYKSVDGNKNEPALIRHTYTFGKTTFVKRKEIQFVGKS